jgi:hypothetical protein
MTAATTSSSPLGSGDSSSLVDVIDTILDKGMVIDAQVNVSVVGINLLSIDARVVIASVDTYLRFAEAVNRLDLTENQGTGLPEVVEGAGKKNMISKAGDILGELTNGNDSVSDGRQRQRQRER